VCVNMCVSVSEGAHVCDCELVLFWGGKGCTLSCSCVCTCKHAHEHVHVRMCVLICVCVCMDERMPACIRVLLGV